MVFIIASDNTLCLPQCENGYGHLSDEQAKEITFLSNVEWARLNEKLINDFRNEFMRFITRTDGELV